MIRSSALYISLIVSILIVLVCGSMLMIGYTYKMQERKQQRTSVLHSNVASGMEILVLQSFGTDSLQKLSLFGTGQDSVLLLKKSWGIYESATVKSWIGIDTLKKAFLIGSALTDTLKVLYLADEDRPMSISGKSLIKGTAYLPKSGIKAAYVESSGYNDKTLVYGKIKDSGRALPDPDAALMKNLQDLLSGSLDYKEQQKGSTSGRSTDLPDTLTNSFFNPVKRILAGKQALILSGIRASGNVIISSDSLIVVAADASLDGIILAAPQVRIESNFKGNVQVLASDSIMVGDSVTLDYPSALMVLKNDTAKFQAKISVGKNSVISGQLFAWEKERSLLMPIIFIAEHSLIKGEVWSQGYVALSKTSEVRGSVSAIRLMARVSLAIYENYLIDVRLDKSRLPKYYLSSKLLNKPAKRGGLLCWVK
jgi:cytoskeletal protein CcmA (bactofilin family)